MADRAELMAEAKSRAQNAKAVAKLKIDAARREADERKAEMANPPSKYITMPPSTGDAELDSAADLDAVSRLQAARQRRRKPQGIGDRHRILGVPLLPDSRAKGRLFSRSRLA